MPILQNSQEGMKLNELVKQVNTISKIVDELQEEVDTLKLNKSRNTNLDSTNTRFKVNDNIFNSNPFQRLRFFRRNDNKTNENIDSNVTLNKNIIDKTIKSDENPNLFQDDKIKRKSRSVQTKIYTDEVIEIPKLICTVKTCSVQTERDSTKNKKKITSDKVIKNKNVSSCNGCSYKRKTKSNEAKNIKFSKLKKRKCAKDCPYLPQNQNIQCKYKIKDTHNTAKKKDKKKYFKNKKIMVDLTNSPHNCEFLKNVDFECKSKNVVKIKQAILTQEPPIIIMSPYKYKSQRGNCCKQKSLRTSCKKILKSLKNEAFDCAQNDKLSESFNSISCPCSSFADPIKKPLANVYSEEMEDYNDTFNNRDCEEDVCNVCYRTEEN